MNKLHCFTYLILILFNCDQSGTDHIVKGQRADKLQFPYFAQVEIKKKVNKGKAIVSQTAGICGASLIHPKWILSAAHCFHNFKHQLTQLAKQDLLKVYMGSSSRLDKNSDINFIAHVVFHDNYGEEPEYIDGVVYAGHHNDIAVAQLKNAYTLSHLVNVTYLPPPNKIGETRTSRCQSGILVGMRLAKRVNRRILYDFNEELLYLKIQSKTRSELQVIVDFSLTKFYSETEWREGHPLTGSFGGTFVCVFNGSPVVYGVISSRPPIPTHIGTNLATYEGVDKQMEFILKTIPEAEFQIYNESTQWRVDPEQARSNTIKIASPIFVIFLVIIMKSKY